MFLPDLGNGSGFLRADGAIKIGINCGFAIPCSTLDGRHYVMAFLSALATPIARQVEIWTADGTGARLLRRSGFSETEGVLGATETLPVAGEGCGALDEAFTTGRPVAAETMIALPIAPQGRTTEVLALHL